MILESPRTEQDLRRRLRPMRARMPLLAVTLFAADALAYAACIWAALHTRGAAAFAWGAAEALAIIMLFIVGHDACHGSLLDSPRWNRWIGTLAFLPSLTPFPAWELAHNQTHHVYTNLKPADHIWTPLTKTEFDALPRRRQWLERLYRSVFGLGLYYLIEVWWRHLFFARSGPGGRMRARDLRGSVVCAGYAAALTAVALSRGLESLLAAVLWPFAVWNWLMGWAIFQHHTHPDVPWFDNPDEWRAAQAQMRCTVHVVVPRPIDFVLHRIMQHTAHHLDVRVPLYGLASAQRVVESDPDARVVVCRAGPRELLRVLRVCKLYDFDRRCWTGFDGVPRR